MGLVEELLGGDWASDELLERDEWTYEADDCMTSAWATASAGGGACAASDPSPSAPSGSAASPWWALAADEENVAVAALAGPLDAKDDVKTERADADADALLTDKVLGLGDAMSPVPGGAKQSLGARDVKSAFSMLLSDDSGSESSARTASASSSSVASSQYPSPAKPSPPKPRTAVKTEAKSTGKKPRRRAGSAGTAATSKPPTPDELAWDEKDLTPLEIRRKRNRESMQRARRRQRDDVEQMKETLLQLEQRYQELSEAALARRAAPAAAVGSPSASLEADYYALADLSHVLKEEKFLLEQMLTDKHKSYRRFEQVMVDRRQELELPCPTTTSPTSLFSDFEFSPLTEHQVNEHIRSCYQHIRLVEETAKPFTTRQFAEIEDTTGKPARRHSTGGSSPMAMFGGEDMEPGCPIPPSATFGWKVKCESTPSGDFFVSFSKFFRAVTAQEAMLNAWQRYSSPQSSPFRRVVRHEVLQVVNDSAYIAGVDIEHPVVPDKCMRAHNLFFRMQTEKGFVIGRYTVNPSPEVRATLERDSPFEYVDSCNWVEFTAQHDEETGDEGVNVKFIASTEYNTQEDMYVRLVNSISRTMNWEYAVMPCPLTLLPS